VNLIDILEDDEFEARKRMPTGKPKAQVEQWVHEGWVARIRAIRCKHCGRATTELVGVFSAERKLPSGARRLQRVEGNFPVGAGKVVEFEPEVLIPYCVDDLDALGFTEVREGEPQGQKLRLVG
jgi:hypothetical protein